MTRDLRRLADTCFDLVVIGAGFYGALAARDATLRGLSVALIDKGDFGGATSFNNSKTLHGGLRSLQSLNFRQMRLFIRERRALARVAPHLVRPMPFVAPTYRQATRSATLMRLAVALNDAVAYDRHQGLADPSLRLPPSAVISREACLQLNPVIDPHGVTGGAVWHDYQMHNADRMTFSFVLSAAEGGAAAANYVEATGLIREDGRVAAVRARDRLTSDAFDVRARAVLNAGGPWAPSILQAFGVTSRTPGLRLSRAMNLVTRRVDTAQGCGGLSRGRFLFLIPWRDVSLVGTAHDAYERAPDQLTVSAQDLDAFVAEAREAFPRAELSRDMIRLVHRGWLPTVGATPSRVRLLRESQVVDHRQDGLAGLTSMFGVRYTTARHTAARAVDTVFHDRGTTAPPPARTDEVPVVGGDIADKERFLADAAGRAGAIPRDVVTRLALTYGTRYRAVLERLGTEPSLAAPLGTQCPVTRGEILHAVRAECAVTLADAVIRRTEAGSAGHPGDDALASAADVVGQELGWDRARVAREIAATAEFYRLPE